MPRLTRQLNHDLKLDADDWASLEGAAVMQFYTALRTAAPGSGPALLEQRDSALDRIHRRRLTCSRYKLAKAFEDAFNADMASRCVRSTIAISVWRSRTKTSHLG